MSTSPRPPRSALVLPVPAAEPVLAEVARRFPATVRESTPAHLTALYPFVPPGALGPDVVAACAAVARDAEPLDVRFVRCLARPGMVYLAPEPAEPVRRLVDAVRARWPEVRPYGGKYPDSPPHVTLALDPGESARDIARLVEPLLPLRARLDELLLVVTEGAGWSVRARLPLGGATPGTAADGAA